MTDDQKGLLRASLFRTIEGATNALPLVETGDVIRLYDHLKFVHDAAIQPWCELVEIMRSEVPARPVPATRPTTDDFLL